MLFSETVNGYKIEVTKEENKYKLSLKKGKKVVQDKTYAYKSEVMWCAEALCTYLSLYRSV